MAFNSTGLILLAEGGFGAAPQLWSYTSTDTSTAVGALGYFSGQGAGSPFGTPRGLKVGDHIIVSQSTAGSVPGQTSFHTVTKSSANSTNTIASSTWGYDVSVSTAPVSTL